MGVPSTPPWFTHNQAVAEIAPILLERATSCLRDAQLALIRALRNGQVRVKTPLGEVTLPERPALWAGLILIGEP